MSGINPHIRNGLDSVLVPLLVLFVLSISWRCSTATILSLAGVLCLYVGMFYVYDNLGVLQFTPSHIANRLGYGIPHIEAPLTGVADFYFMMGIFALILCMAVAFRPSIFKAKGAASTRLPYPVWTRHNQSDLRIGLNANSVLSLVPVQSLLSYAEYHLVAKYKYIEAMIAGRIYFVLPDDWVPECSSIIRDKESGSLLGIPKVGDGFNISD